MQNTEQNSQNPQNFLRVVVSEEDIAECGSGLLGNPIARALSRATKRRWRVWDGRIAQQVCEPDRVLKLPEEVQNAWDQAADLSKLPPFTFQIEMDDPKYAA